MAKVENIQSKFTLNEEDIPGARLPKNVDNCSVTVLKRWLACRGAKVTGKLQDLRERVKHYIKNGLDKKYLRDPDGGIHVLKKKAEAGLLSESTPPKDELNTFPKDGYDVDLSKIPNVTFGTVWKFMIETVACKKQIATAKPLVKGYNFFKSNNVVSIYHQAIDGKHYFKSQVLPSMKKGMLYTCFIVLSSFGFVLRGCCGCPAGKDGRCNHVAATLFGLDEFVQKRTKEKNQQESSCTSKPCKWSVPPKRKGEVHPISKMMFKKHDYSKVKKARKSLLPPEKDVRAEGNQAEWSFEKKQNMLEQILVLQKKTGRIIGWSHILPQDPPQAQDSAESGPTSEEQNMCNVLNDPLDIISPIKELPVSYDEIKQRGQRIKRKLFVREDEVREIESQTRSQSENPLWHFHRAPRITASKCHRIASLKATTSPTKVIREILYTQVRPTMHMREGLSMERVIRDEYTAEQLQRGHKNLTVKNSGFVISLKSGFLGASPDGNVCDPSETDHEGLLEMKFIQTKENESLEDALIRKRMCIKNALHELTINKTHAYYYQVQQSMFVCERHWTDFVVKASKAAGIYIERVPFNSNWWREVQMKMELFYDSHLLPELAYPRIKFGLPRAF